MEKPKTKPKFKRTPTGKIRITNRDIEVLLSLHEYRLLRSTHILALHNTFSVETLRRRLRNLFHHGYVDRIYEKTIHQPGEKPFIYAISTKGFRYLAKQGLVAEKRTDFTKLNRKLTDDPKEHRLLIAEFITGIKSSCAKDPNISFIEPKEILANSPEKTKQQSKPFQWCEKITWKGEALTIWIVPDFVFGLRYQGREQGRDKLYFCLEACTGLMPNKRSCLKDQSAIYKKMLVYHASHKSRTYAKKFNIKNLRTVFYTPITGRVENMITANKAVNRGLGSRVFLFADQATFLANNPLKMNWLNGRDEKPRPITE